MVGIHFDLSHVNCYYIVLTIHCTFYDLFTGWNLTICPEILGGINIL